MFRGRPVRTSLGLIDAWTLFASHNMWSAAALERCLLSSTWPGWRAHTCLATPIRLCYALLGQLTTPNFLCLVGAL